MLRLTTAAGERLEIPAASIAMVAQLPDVEGCVVAFDLGCGSTREVLSDSYGFVKKAAVDCLAMINPVEVRLAGAQQAEGARPGLLFFSRDAIVARREVRGNDEGVKAIITINVTGQPTPYPITDTLDEMDGVAAAEPTAEPDETNETEEEPEHAEQ